MKSLFLLVPAFCAVLSAADAQVTIRLLPPKTAKTVGIQPIAAAKQEPFGTVISVAGRVTVADEFGGPIYMQDATAGIAVFDQSLHAAVEIGDSVIVTGPYTEFGATSGEPGTGLGQISGQGTTWQIVGTEPSIPAPTPVQAAAIGEQNEGLLVRIGGAVIEGATGAPRAFQQNKNYDVGDGSGTVQLRIDNNTNLVGAPVPEGTVAIVGVVGQYRGTYQILPRFTDDLGLDVPPNPWDTLAKEQTLDITTWNLEWFGDPQNGPEDDSIQLRNVIRVIDSIDADLYGLQEVANRGLFLALLDSLPQYGGLYSYEIGQPQKMAYLFKRSVIDSVHSAHVLKTAGSWGGGRYPLQFVFDATVQGETRRINAFLIHAKATGEVPADDYQQRMDDATALYNFLNSVYRDHHVVVLGDFNDDVDESTYNNQPSPYRAFVDNTERYAVITKSLSDRGVSSYSKGTNMLDHILVSDELAPYVLPGAEKVENVSYIGSYLSTTSDHYPVTARLRLTASTSVPDAGPETATVRVVPNPVRSTAAVEYTVQEHGHVRLELVTMLGETIAVLCDTFRQPGRYTVAVPVPDAGGVYYCRLTAGGRVVTARLVVVR